MKRTIITTTILLLLAACQPQAPVSTNLTDIPFPTATLGRVLVGNLPPPQFVPESGDSSLANPATAIAEANQPTPTPDRRSCPVQVDGAVLSPRPATSEDASQDMARFFSAGGKITDLEDQLLNDWESLPDEGYLRDDVDLTGEGTPEMVVGYTAPGEIGTLLIFGCLEGRYQRWYEATADGAAPPQLLWLEDMNRDFRADLLFASRRCDEADTCPFETQMVSWDRDRGRFVNVINNVISSFTPPSLNDIDNDSVAEIVVPLDSRGTSATGPLRTGVHIYDWNGASYVLSIIQLDPPRYRVQVVHEADRNFVRLDMDAATSLYERALSDEEDLVYWFNDGATSLYSYILYRLLISYAFTTDERYEEIRSRINGEFPVTEETNPADLPVYIEMALAFINGLETSNTLHRACEQVQVVIEQRDDALDLINRYGSRSPTYTALDLCPF